MNGSDNARSLYDESTKAEDSFNEDDGFFSDVPGSGSLSRSLLALNKYVKKNLFFDEEDEYANDDAYFSKETTPNDSVVKDDSDSVHSNESVQQFNSSTISEQGLVNLFPHNIINKPPCDIAILKINKLIFEPVSKIAINYTEETINAPTNIISSDIDVTQKNIKTEELCAIHCDKTDPVDVILSNPQKEITLELISKSIQNDAAEPINDIVEQQTDDYKSRQLVNASIEINEIPNSVEIDRAPRNISSSLDNITSITEPVYENVCHNKVILRERPPGTSSEENRHTIHDLSEWVNRTTIYPDVYAPLPYKSPRRYVESDVNIHYRCPVRHDPLPLVPERELAMQQAEHMKRLYREQRRNKYLQELQDMQNRRHQDNFTPSQKAVVPLNRYDEAERVVARSLYAFNGQTPRELSFRKGDLIHVRRQIDANWYEGEIHGKVGLFPYNYVEIQKGDVVQSTKKQAVVEGRARAKFDFTAQTNLELPLKKGEVVVLTRRIDQNWWEGRNGSKTGIFPDSYVTILQEPSQSKPETKGVLNTDKPVASPAAHGLLNGSAKRSMGAHSYTPQPNSPALSNAPPATQPLPGYPAKPTQVSLTPSERGYGPPTGQGVDLNNTEPLYVDTNAEAIPYRAMYKYRPQNPDELELNEGDTVYVLEKCDDGWYVGSSQRTGRFGTFPGNYVERI